ncbi:MAG: DNA topoisomerase IB, partial [Rhodanobacter sp.]
GGEQARRRALAQAVAQVAAILGNTPTVCRGSYIHPRVLEGWLDGRLQRAVAAVAAHPRQLERALLRFLR